QQVEVAAIETTGRADQHATGAHARRADLGDEGSAGDRLVDDEAAVAGTIDGTEAGGLLVEPEEAAVPADGVRAVEPAAQEEAAAARGVEMERPVQRRGARRAEAAGVGPLRGRAGRDEGDVQRLVLRPPEESVKADPETGIAGLAKDDG